MSNTHSDYTGVSSAGGIPKRIIEHRDSEAFTYPLFGSRYSSVFPSTRKVNEYFKSAASDIKIDNNEIAVLKDPYSPGMKMRLGDAYVNDPIVRRCITVNVSFLLGRRLTTTIDSTQESMNQATQEQVLSDTLNAEEVDKLKTLIDNINTQVNFHAKIEAAATQAYVGGRAALYVERAQGNMPVDLRVLNWSKLGQVYADKESWQFLGVEYADRPKDEPLLANEIIYFPYNDYNITPDSLYHGRSTIETVLDAVETNRFIHAEDLKETARSLWAPGGLIHFPPNTTNAKIKEFLRGFLPGVMNATSQQVTMEKMDLDPKIKELSDVSLLLDRRIRTGLGTPGILVGDENVLNYATAGMVMHAWREGDLNKARTWLQDVLEPQWFNSLILLAYPGLDVKKMMLKAKLAYEDITFETLRDRAESLMPAVQSGYVSVEKFLEVLDMPEEIEKRAALLEEQQKKRAEDLELMKMEREKQKPQEEDNNNKQPPQFDKEKDTEEEDNKKKKKVEASEHLTAQAVKDEVMGEVTRMLDIQKQQQESQQKQQEPQVPLDQLVAILDRPIQQPQPQQMEPRQIEIVKETQLKPETTNEDQLRVLQASLAIQEQKQRQMEEIHHKQLEVMDEKREAYRQLRAKIADLS